MARIRRDSSESFPGGDTANKDQTRLDQNTTIEPPKARQKRDTRSSPRKKLAKADREVGAFCDEHRSEPPVLAPKAAPPRDQRSKQVRLAPLTTLRNAAGPLKLDVAIEPRRSRRSPRKQCPPSVVESPAEGEAELQVPAHLSEPAVVQEVEESDVEESVWCGSAGNSDSSDDELPSPSKFIKFPPTKLLPKAPSEGIGFDLSRSLKALSLSEENPFSKPETKQVLTISDSSRPTSSSDNENRNKAILRFSPPRLHIPPKQCTPEHSVTPPPTSPSKGRLLSPSKRTARLPTPPHRPSLDAFWNAETVNDWNDQYSPRKEWKSPRKLKLLADDASTSPTSSPRKAQSPSKRTKAELDAKKDWEARKHRIAETFLSELDRTITDGQVQELAKSTGGVRFIWSKMLNSTAGRANWKRETTKTRQPDGTVSVVHKHHASIELAEKVIDDEDRLLNVIAHEFCHLCNFMISGIKDQPHGRQFKDWGRKCTKAFGDRGVEVTTKHTYQIEYKYIWQCSNGDCGVEFKRHSKSIDPKRHTCGSCRSHLQQTKPVPRAGGAATGYAGYVKQHFAEVKARMPGATQKLIMEAVARKYRAEKALLLSAGAPAASATGERGLDARGGKPGRGSGSSAPSVTPGPGDGGLGKISRVLEFVTLDDD